VGGFGALDRLPSNPPPPGSPAGETNAAPAPLTPAANPKAPASDGQLPAVQKAAVDLAPGKGEEAAQSPAPAPQTSTPPLAPSPPPVQDPSEIAVKMKIGADLVASGDFAAARTMFERVAEAGDAAGAFALAETYDPAVLRTLRLRGGVKADPALARRWYEMARDMGSAAAIDRIARLTQSSR
jgi:TPR repeat protein